MYEWLGGMCSKDAYALAQYELLISPLATRRHAYTPHR
jgi:hypothetical protein